MGDISAEPSMEEILSSIKRIIAEEEAPTGRKRANRLGPAAGAPASAPAPDGDDDEVLELSDPMPPGSAQTFADMPSPASARAPLSLPHDTPAPAESGPIVSPAALDATRGALESLSRLIVKPEPQGDGTLEGLVRDMLRPMLRDWLDAHLPDLVEAMVAKEIARISGQPR